MNPPNFWGWQQQMQLPRQTNISNEQQMMDESTLRGNKEASSYLQTFLLHNPNPSNEQVAQVAKDIKISQEYVINLLTLF
jgi:hypothetical protein